MKIMEHVEIVGVLESFFEEEDLLEDISIMRNGTDLIDSGVVDSLVLVMLIGLCEERFNCTLEPDEIVVHVQCDKEQNEEQLSDKISQQFQSDAEIRPNRIEFHDTETLKKMQGVGVSIKEDKIVDHRPKSTSP